MNIFYLHECPQQAAIDHADVHCSKMMIEYAQLLSTAHRVTDSPWAEDCYKIAHKNHPSTIWTRESTDHYTWLYDLWHNLANEFFMRRGKDHASWTKLKHVLSHNPPHLPRNGFTAPPQCMPDECKRDDTVEAYRGYYVYKKLVEGKRINWEWDLSGCVPTWFQEKALVLSA